MRKSNEYLPNHINIYWCVDDIKSRDEYNLLSERDCREILDTLLRTHDASIGINLDIIDAVIENFLRNKNNA